MPPRASAHRWVTRDSTGRPVRCSARAPPAGPASSRQRSSGPSATTLTRPSSRFSAKPLRPSSSARARTHQRKPTPWTRPSTHAVSRTSAGRRHQRAVPRSRLADRAAVGGPVHERIAADQGAAPAARLAGPPVDVQRPVEVAALAVHVDVEAVEGGAAVRERLGEHVRDRMPSGRRSRPGAAGQSPAPSAACARHSASSA